MGSGAKAHPDPYFSKKYVMKIFRKKMTMGTKCAASTRGVVRMVALSHACVCGKVCAHVSRVPIGNRSRSWPQFYKNKGIDVFNKTLLVGQRSFFTVACLILCISLVDLDAER